MRLKNCITLLALALGGCSPYVYSTEINSFSTGVTSVSTSYATGRQTFATDDANTLDQNYATSRQPLSVTPGCSQVDPNANGQLPVCAIVKTGDTTPPAPSREVAALTNAAPAFTALQNYSTALAAITNASDDASLTTATTTLSTSVNDLDQAIAKLAPAAAQPSAIVKAAEPLFALGAKTYLDQRRYEILRKIVPASDGAVATLAFHVEAALASFGPGSSES